MIFTLKYFRVMSPFFFKYSCRVNNRVMDFLRLFYNSSENTENPYFKVNTMAVSKILYFAFK